MFKIAASALAQKVTVELYMESECPYCQNTILGSFAEAYNHTDLLDMAEVTIIPYGNAHEYADGDSWTFSCQHGTKECNFNSIENCSNHYIDDLYQRYWFLNCIETNSGGFKPDYDNVILTCRVETGLSIAVTNSITNCWDSEEGIQLTHDAAVVTDSLNPSHQYVPWIVGQGVHSDDIQGQIETSLWDYVCANYTGFGKSPDCPATAEAPVAATKNGVCLKTADLFLQ